VTGPPPAASAAFGDRLPLASRFATLLAGPAIVRGLLGPAEAARIWDRHLLNCAAITPLIGTGAPVIDIGTGAGLPGLVLAIARPDLPVRCLEAKARAAEFLDEAVRALGLANVTVTRARAEEVAGKFTAAVVTARAVAPLARLARLAGPFLEPGGQLLAIKGERAAEELAAAGSLPPGLGDARVEDCLIGGERFAAVIRVCRATRREGP
jgi:16S rRNA (guanine527-N7)-methyltransferase